jgi:hypothetical protein
VPVDGQADILVSGIPYISPYNVNAYLNPLLVQVMAQGYLFNMYRGQPLVKKGGTMIVTHPCSDQLRPRPARAVRGVRAPAPARDAGGHGAAQEVRGRVRRQPGVPGHVPEGPRVPPGAPVLHVVLGRGGQAAGGRVIVVGADNEYIPRLLGYETARSMHEALEMAKDTAPPSPAITCFQLPPIVMADMSRRVAQGRSPAGRCRA